LAAADVTTRPTDRVFADRVNRLALPSAAISLADAAFLRREKTGGNSHVTLICHGPLQQLDAMRKRALHQ
jgi:hypothetical protein